MKRATLLLEDELYRRAKLLSRRRGGTLKEVINELVRKGLEIVEARKAPGKMSLPLHRGNGPLPGVDVADRDALYDRMEE